MNILELVALFREFADDTAEDYRWSDNLLLDWFADAEDEACIRAGLITDERTIALSTPGTATLAATTGTLDDGTYSYRVSAINASGETLASTAATLAVSAGAGSNGVTVSWTAITGATGYKIYGRASGTELLMYTAGEADTSWTDDGSVTASGALPKANGTEDIVKISLTSGRVHYPLHDTIVEVKRAYITDGTTDYHLKITDRDVLDSEVRDWRNTTERPTRIIVDDTEVRVAATPGQAYTLMLEVKRKPTDAEKMTELKSSVSPTIHKDHHKHLVDWVLWRAYSQRNVDKYAPKRAERHNNEFERYFGFRPTSSRREAKRRDTPHRTRCHW